MQIYNRELKDETNNYVEMLGIKAAPSRIAGDWRGFKGSIDGCPVCSSRGLSHVA